jgi:hypothetical protein
MWRRILSWLEYLLLIPTGRSPLMRRMFHPASKGRVSWGIPLQVAAVITAAAWGTYAGCAASSALPAGEETPVLGQYSVAIYGLSRGKGVPEATRRVIEDIRAIAETGKQQGRVKEWRQTRIGLEGETRVCVDLRNESAKHDFLRQLREMVQGVDLINVVEEPCSQP